MSSFPLTFIFSKMVETTNPYMFISHPQTYDDPQVQLPPCHSLGPTKGGGGGAGCSHLVECDLGTRIHAGSLGLFLVDVQCLGFSCFSRFKCNIYFIWPVHACFLRMCNLQVGSGRVGTAVYLYTFFS